MYKYIYVGMNIRMYVSKYVCMYVCMHGCIYISMYVSMNICCRLVWLEEHKATNRVLVCQYLPVH